MIKQFSPAKINLFLHILGKRDDGYHLLQSLVTFADFGDWITLTPAKAFSLQVTGPYADFTPVENNIVERAARRLAQITNNTINLSILIEKNIPVGAGLGGGSSNAAAILHALLKYWSIEIKPDILNPILLELGADVPLCFIQKTALVFGVGEIINPVSIPNNLYAVLIYPNKHCSTADIFEAYGQKFSSVLEYNLEDWNDDFLHRLKTTKNDLTSAAINNIADIQNILTVFEKQKDCIFSRMTGSGSCYFGLFKTKDAADNAAKEISNNNPQWWVNSVILNPTA